MSLDLAATSMDVVSRRTGGRLLTGITFECNLRGGVALVGQSGSGKTLTCRALVDLVPSGLVQVGKVSYPTGRGALGAVMIPQHAPASLPPRQSALQLVAGVVRHCGAHAGTSPFQEACKHLGRVGLREDAYHLWPHQLSGGMAQRVALAAALATAAAWVVLDEPTVGLDPVAKQGLFSVLASVKRDGTGILIATHDAVFARALCDEAIVLKEGRCVCFGKMRQVIENREGKRVLFVRSDCDYRTEADPG